MSGGRPSKFTPEIGDRVCELVASGYTWRQIFAMEGMPTSMQQVVGWERNDNAFHSQLTLARQAAAELTVDDMNDVVQRTPDPHKARLLTDIAKWKASKWSTRYADRIDISLDQKVSITAALDQAEARLRPVRDQRDTVDLIPSDISGTYEVGATDYGSVATLDPPSQGEQVDAGGADETPTPSWMEW